MKRLILILAAMMFSPLYAEGGMVFDLVPSANTTNINGIQFSPDGGDLVVTNTLVSEESDPILPLWLDFRVLYDHKDSFGNVFYVPDNFAYQDYVLKGYLTKDSGVIPILVRTLMDGESEAYNLGSGRYEYKAAAIGGNIDMVFNTNLPLGRQVESGTFTYDVTAAPEPPTFILMGFGISLVGICCVYRRKNKE